MAGGARNVRATLNLNLLFVIIGCGHDVRGNLSMLMGRVQWIQAIRLVPELVGPLHVSNAVGCEILNDS